LTRDDAITFTNAHPDWSFILAPQFRAENSDVVILSASQVLLTIAEAIQLGWVTGDKNKFYSDGIKASWERWGVYTASRFNAYMQGTNVALDNTAADLVKINTQKWVAIYPDGRSGWTEWRRTGLPALTPSPRATSSSKQIPRRFSYPSVEYNLNRESLNAALGRLGGPDNQDGRVWWDK